MASFSNSLSFAGSIAILLLTLVQAIWGCFGITGDGVASKSHHQLRLQPLPPSRVPLVSVTRPREFQTRQPLPAQRLYSLQPPALSRRAFSSSPRGLVSRALCRFLAFSLISSFLDSSSLFIASWNVHYRQRFLLLLRFLLAVNSGVPDQSTGHPLAAARCDRFAVLLLRFELHPYDFRFPRLCLPFLAIFPIRDILQRLFGPRTPSFRSTANTTLAILAAFSA